MSQAELRHLLNMLREELEFLEVNSDVRKESSLLITEIELQLQTLEADRKRTSITDKIRNHIEKFEEEHPRFTNILNDLLLRLLSIGV